MSEYSLLFLIAAWLTSSQRCHVGLGMNRSARGRSINCFERPNRLDTEKYQNKFFVLPNNAKLIVTFTFPQVPNASRRRHGRARRRVKSSLVAAPTKRTASARRSSPYSMSSISRRTSRCSTSKPSLTRSTFSAATVRSTAADRLTTDATRTYSMPSQSSSTRSRSSTATKRSSTSPTRDWWCPPSPMNCDTGC